MASQPSSQNSSTPAPSLIPMGDFAGKPPLKLSKAVIIVGSDEHCHYRLTSSTISRLHALIIHEDRGVYIRDLASRTKVFINGNEAKEAALKDGDEVRIGRFQFKFASPDKSPGSAVHPAAANIVFEGETQPVPMLGRTLLIGREAGCDVALADQSVSARHAVIFEFNGKRILRDLNSRSSTTLNGEKIHQQSIHRGDLLRAGDVTMKLTRKDESAKPESAKVGETTELIPAEEIAAVVAPALEPEPQVEPVEEPLPVSPAEAPVAEIDHSIEEEVPLGFEPLETPAEAFASTDQKIDLSSENTAEELTAEPEGKAASHEDHAVPVIDLSIPTDTSPAGEMSDKIDLSFEGLLNEVAPAEFQPNPEPAAGEGETEKLPLVPDFDLPVEAEKPEMARPIEPEIAPVEVTPEPVVLTPEPEPAPAAEAESLKIPIDIVSEPAESEPAPVISDIDFQPETTPIEISNDLELPVAEAEPEITLKIPATDIPSVDKPVEIKVMPAAELPHFEAPPVIESTEPEATPAMPAFDFASETKPIEIAPEPAAIKPESEPSPALELVEPESTPVISDIDFSLDDAPIQIPSELPEAVEATAVEPISTTSEFEQIDTPVQPAPEPVVAEIEPMLDSASLEIASAAIPSAEPPEITIAPPVDAINLTANAGGMESPAPAPFDGIDFSFDSPAPDAEPQIIPAAEVAPEEPISVEPIPADTAATSFPEIDFSFDSVPALEPVQPIAPAIEEIQEPAPIETPTETVAASETESLEVPSAPAAEVDFSAEFALLDRELEERHRTDEPPASEILPLSAADEAPALDVPVMEQIADSPAVIETPADAAPIEIPAATPKRRGRPPKLPKVPKPPRTRAKRVGPKDKVEESSLPPAASESESVDEILPALPPLVETVEIIADVPVPVSEIAASIVEVPEPIETVDQGPFPLPVLEHPAPEPAIEQSAPAVVDAPEPIETIAEGPPPLPVVEYPAFEPQFVDEPLPDAEIEEPATASLESEKPVEAIAETPLSPAISEVPELDSEPSVPEIPVGAASETTPAFDYEEEFHSVLPKIDSELSETLTGPEPEIFESVVSPPQPSVIGDLSIPTLGFTASSADVVLPEIDENGSATIDITPPAVLEPGAPVVDESATPQPMEHTPTPPLHPPISFIGDPEFFSGGTVNLDHHLGGMPVRLPEVAPVTYFHGGMPIELPPLPPNPEGFGQIHYDLEGTSASLFSSRPVPPPVAPLPPPPPEPLSESPFVPITLPSPDLMPPVVEKAPPAPLPPRVMPIPRSAVLKSAPRAEKKSAPFSSSASEIGLESQQPRTGDGFNPPGLAETPPAFDGLAMPVRQTDVFSNFEAAPINDAPFGGVPLNQADDYIVPESAAGAERLAESSEHDFAEDEFWNRTDEEDDLREKVAVDPLNPAPTPSIPVPPPSPADSVELDVDEPEEIEPEAEATAEESSFSEEPILAEDTAFAEDVATSEADQTESESNESEVESSRPENPPSRARRAASPLSAVEESAKTISDDEHAAISRPLGKTSYPAPGPPPRKKRRFRIPFLMPMILIAGMIAAVAAIWKFVPVQSQIVGKLTFDNFIWAPGTQDSNEFEAAQRRLLDDPQTHQHALDILKRDHAGVSPGFLSDPGQVGRAVSSFSLNSIAPSSGPQTILQLSYSGVDPKSDRLRMLSLMQSLVDANRPLLESNRRIRDAAQNSQQAVTDIQNKLDQIKAQLAAAQQAIDNQPSTDDMARFTNRNADLQLSRQGAEEAVNNDRGELASLQSASEASGTVSPTTQPAIVDPQLSQMRQQLADLTSDMDSARSDQVAGAVIARQQLESAAKDFSDRLENASNALASGSQLRQFVDSAMDSQTKARDLIDMLIVDGEDLEKQLEDTRRDVEELIQSRRQEKWDADTQLADLRDKLNIAQHQYNANVGDGVTDPRILDPLQREIDDCTAKVKARQDQLGVDPGEIKVQEALNGLIDSLRNKLDREKRQIDEVLDPLEKQLSDLDPVVAALPTAQQDLARDIHDRLDALDKAREKYAQTVGEGPVAPSAKITDLQSKIADLKSRIDARQADLTQQMVKSLDNQRAQNLKDAQARLDRDQQSLDAARKAGTDAINSFADTQARYNAAQGALTKKLTLLDQQRTAYTQLESARRDRDDKQAAAEHAFVIRPQADSDVAPIASGDPRMMYSLFVLGAGLVGLTFLALFSRSAGQAQPFKSARQSAGEIDSLVIPLADGSDQASDEGEELSDDDEHPLPV